jgi:hypothetical protein
MRFCAACFVGLLFGCSAGTSLPPYTLSEADMNAVKHGIYSYSVIKDKPKVRIFKAATSSGGEVYVCGWIDSESKIYRALEQAFTGILSAGQFSAERIGKDANTNAIVVAKCHERGISIL